MKPFRLILLVCLMLFNIFSSGCSGTNSAVSPSTAADSLPLAFHKNTITITSSPTPNITSISHPELANTLTQSPSATERPTEIPTLANEDAQQKLLDLLANNGNCRLPCLWGITPGKSKSKDSNIILEPLGGISDFFTNFDEDSGLIEPCFVENELEICASISYLTYQENDVVSRIMFTANTYEWLEVEREVRDVFDLSYFGDILQKYSLPQVLLEFGEPPLSYLFALAEMPDPNRGPAYYKLLIVYPEQGFQVEYITEMYFVGDKVMGCFANSHIEIISSPLGNTEAFFNSIETTWEHVLRNYLPIEEVTDFTLEEFYNHFLISSDGCLETLANYWTFPEK